MEFIQELLQLRIHGSILPSSFFDGASAESAYSECCVVANLASWEEKIEECGMRIRALTLIQRHVVPEEQYLLDQQDLQFAEMLPPPPQPEWPVCMGRR